MRYVDFKPLREAKKLGRTFNHLEDLVFFHGAEGATEALEHLRDFATENGATSIRMKWDGNPQVYWGRAENGTFSLAGHNGWSRGAMANTAEDLQDFIVNGSGNPKTPEEKAARQEFGSKFASLWDMFERATPTDFRGYVYADALYLDLPQLKDSVYTFCPNPHSQTCYHVRQGSELGKRIAKSKVMVVGHAEFSEFGQSDNSQVPKKDFSEFNESSELIVLGPIYNSKPVKIDTRAIDETEAYAKQHANQVDGFLESMKGLGDLKDILYRFVNQTAKAKKLDQLSPNLFWNWLKTSKVSAGKQARIKELDDKYQHALSAIFELLQRIQGTKDEIIDQIDGEQGDIWDTNGEGRVRYADKDKKFGNIKLVPRKQWVPG
jgi:hypothetical protein